MKISGRLTIISTIATLLFVIQLVAQPRQDDKRVSQEEDNAKIRQALGDVAADFWIYEDVEAGFAASKRTGKPILLSIR